MARDEKRARRVVVTGIGPVSSVGRGAGPFFAAMLDRRTAARPIPEGYKCGYGWRSRWYVPCPAPAPDDRGFERGIVRMMDGLSLLACEAASFAVEDAGIETRSVGRGFSCVGLERAAVLLGVGVGHLDSAFRAHRAHIHATAETFSKMAAVHVMGNAPAAWVSILFGLRGESACVSTACSSATAAIGQAYEGIASGRTDAALCGGVERLEDQLGTPMRGFDTLGALTSADDGNPRVFSERRSGFLFADGGACVLVLEEEERARRRGARVYAEITGYAAACEAYNIVQMDPAGETVEALLRALGRGDRIDYLNAHGTGTLANDAIERAVIGRCFGSGADQPLVGSSKNGLGHTIGASGAFEAAVTALSIHEQRVHGMDIDDPMDDLNLALESKPAAIERALSMSYGFGGHDAGLRFERYEG